MSDNNTMGDGVNRGMMVKTAIREHPTDPDLSEMGLRLGDHFWVLKAPEAEQLMRVLQTAVSRLYPDRNPVDPEPCQTVIEAIAGERGEPMIAIFQDPKGAGVVVDVTITNDDPGVSGEILGASRFVNQSLKSALIEALGWIRHYNLMVNPENGIPDPHGVSC